MSPTNFKDLFLLDPEITFLNHGSFGATPRPVMAAYQAWQLRLERQPVLFLGREIIALHRQARQALGDYLHVNGDDLVYVPNATHGVNIVARALKLRSGDEILTSDHEYGACENAWEFVCRQSGAVYRRQPLPLPAHGSQDMLERLWQGVNDRTRIIFLSQISSPTAIRLPVEAICRKARQAGILTLIDGAHAPGQIPLDLAALGADFYTGNCHKWMLAPKGAGFLYAHPQVQSLIEPLVVSWGYHADPATSSHSQFINYLEWTGTRDPAAELSVPEAIRFMDQYHWEAIRQTCRAQLAEALQAIAELTGSPPAYPLDEQLYIQMGVAELPRLRDLRAAQARLYAEHRIEVPLIEWNKRHFVRISVQAYNTAQDLERLVQALAELLPEMRA